MRIEQADFKLFFRRILARFFPSYFKLYFYFARRQRAELRNA